MKNGRILAMKRNETTHKNGTRDEKKALILRFVEESVNVVTIDVCENG